MESKIDIQYRTELKDNDGRVIATEGYAFHCSPPCDFDSSGWATEDAVTERAFAHQEEHVSGEPMKSMDDFIKERGTKVVMSEVRASGATLKDVRPKGVK